jgi:hypothetical protein
MTRRRWQLLLVVVLVLLAYSYAAVVDLPPWIVSLTAGKADANTQLNAITSTRGALLGILTPLVVLIGGIVGLLNFQEIRAQNAVTNERARIERDETRRLRRAEVYAGLASACHACWEASSTVFNFDPETVNLLYQAREVDHNYLWYLSTKDEKSAAMDLAHDQVILLGVDAVQASAFDLVLHCHAEIAMKAGVRPKVSDEEWRRIAATEYKRLQRAFVDAARKDLALTR